MAKTVRAGVIGFGLAGKKFHAAQMDAVDGIEVAAVASSRTEEIRTAFPAATIHATPQALIADSSLDLVVVATPNDAHAALAIAAMQAGKAVVVDKPFTVTSEEARRVITAAKETGQLLSVYHNRRWDGDFLTVKDEIAAGHLGDVFYFESHFDRYRPEPSGNWREQNVPAAGLWYDLAPHLIDQAVRLFGKPDSILADMAVQRDGVAATDFFHVILRFGKTRAVLMASALAPADDLRFIIHGDQASLIIAGADAAEAAKRPGKRIGTTAQRTEADGRVRNVPLIVDDRTAFYAGMRDAVLGKAPVPVAPEDALLVMEILAAGDKSAAEGCTITFG